VEKCLVVEFVKQAPPYNTGETAGFSEEDAQRLFKNGLVRMRPDIEGKFAGRSPGLDLPNFSMQQLAGIVRAAADDVATSEKHSRRS
jgi:hypothetical protein